MTIHFFNAQSVAKKLAHGVVTKKEGYHYLVASFILAMLSAYGG